MAQQLYTLAQIQSYVGNVGALEGPDGVFYTPQEYAQAFYDVSIPDPVLASPALPPKGTSPSSGWLQSTVAPVKTVNTPSVGAPAPKPAVVGGVPMRSFSGLFTKRNVVIGLVVLAVWKWL